MQAAQTQRAEAGWVPKTKVGRMVQSGQIVSLEDIFTQGLKMKEPAGVVTRKQGIITLFQSLVSMEETKKELAEGQKEVFKALNDLGVPPQVARKVLPGLCGDGLDEVSDFADTLQETLGLLQGGDE